MATPSLLSGSISLFLLCLHWVAPSRLINACACSVSRQKKDPRVNDRDISDLAGGWVDGELTGLKQEHGVIPHHEQRMVGQDHGGNPCFWGQGRLPVTGRIDVSLAPQVARETSRGEGVYLK